MVSVAFRILELDPVVSKGLETLIDITKDILDDPEGVVEESWKVLEDMVKVKECVRSVDRGGLDKGLAGSRLRTRECVKSSMDSLGA